MTRERKLNARNHDYNDVNTSELELWRSVTQHKKEFFNHLHTLPPTFRARTTRLEPRDVQRKKGTPTGFLIA